MKNSISLIIFSFLLSLTGCVHAQSVQTQMSGSVFVDSTHRFSFRPPTLSVDSVSSDDVVALFYTPTNGGAGKEAFTLILVLNTRTTRDEYRQMEQKRFKEGGMTVTLDSNLTINGVEAILSECNGIVRSKDVETIGLALITPDKVYSIAATCPRNEYSQYSTALRNSLMSFKFF